MIKKYVCELVALGSLAISLLAGDKGLENAVGTWKMNEAKSHFDKGQEEKDYTIVFSIANGIATVAVDGMGGFYGPDKRMTFKMTVPVEGGPMTYIENGPGPELDIHDVWKVVDDHTSELTSDARKCNRRGTDHIQPEDDDLHGNWYRPENGTTAQECRILREAIAFHRRKGEDNDQETYLRAGCPFVWILITRG